MRYSLLALLVVISFLSLAAAPASKPAKTITLTVVDQATGKPIGGVAVGVAHGNVRTSHTTGDDGAVAVSYDQATSYMSVSCRKDGYVSTFVRWSHNSADPIPLPESFTVRMPAGKTIGGLIVDEDGKPVALAKVILDRYTDTPDALPSIESGMHDETIQTDAAGKWLFNGYPAGAAAGATGAASDGSAAGAPIIGIRVQHPDFINDQQFRGEAKELLSQSLRLVLKRGVEVTGEVVSVRGKPIRGAKVTTISDAHVVNDYGATTRSAADGTFRLPHLPAEQTSLTITATGFAPELKKVTLVTGMEPLKITLPDPSRIAARVVDDHGKPLAKVYVSVTSWRGAESIAWRGETDTDGHFAWADAPSDAVQFSLNKTGYRYVFNKELTASPDEQTVTMQPVPRVSGTVTDAVTHQPIESFTAIPGTGFWEGRAPMFSFGSAKQFKGGTYDFPINASNGTLASYVRIEAKGYKPVISPPITSVTTFSPELQLAPDMTGTLVDPDGKAVAGARVCLATPGAQINIYSNAVRTSDIAASKTDEQGHFLFGPQVGDIYFCVLTDAGFVFMKGDSSAAKVELKLKPWSRIEGTFRPGGKTGEYAQVNFEHYRDRRSMSPNLQWVLDCKIDPAGNMSMPHVPSFDGECCYVQLGQYDRKAGKNARWEIPVRTEPGKTIQLNIDGQRTLKGHLAPATPADKVADPHGMILFSPAHEKPASEWPTSIDEAKAKATPHYGTGVEADGSFTMPSVPAGKYEYCVLSYTRGSEYAASGVITVEAGDGAIDVGNIEYVRAGVKPGDPAPPTLGRTFDDKPIRTADYAGKYVVAVLWDNFTGRTDRQLDDLDKLAASLASDKDVALLSINIDDADLMMTGVHCKPATLKNAAWIAAYMPFSDEQLIPRIGSNERPTILLIGPDGKVLSHESQAKDVAAKLAGFRK